MTDTKRAAHGRTADPCERTVRDWLSRMDKDAKEARNLRIFDLWLACWTQQEISEEIGISQPQLAEVLKNIGIGNLAKPDKAAAEHATDFEVPIYNIWKQQEKSAGSDHFGNSEVRCGKYAGK